MGDVDVETLVDADALLAVIWNETGRALVLYDGTGRRLRANPAGTALLAALSETRTIYRADGLTLSPEPDWPLHGALAGELVPGVELMIRNDLYPQGRRLLVSAVPIPLADASMGALLELQDIEPSGVDRGLAALLGGLAGQAILQFTVEGEVQTGNENAERLIGARLAGTFNGLFAAEERAVGRPDSLLARAVSGSSAGVPLDGRWVRADGSVIWVEGRLAALRDRAGTVTGFVAVVRDITARHLTEAAGERQLAELRRANQLLESRIRERTMMLERRTAELLNVSTELESFSHSVSHDLRAPVRSVQGFARIVRDRYGAGLPEDGRYYLDRIEAGAVRMGQLVDALIRLARLQRQPLFARRVDMSELVTRCWTALAEHRPGHQVELAIGSLEVAEGDEQLLGQVWMNLLDNAVKYSTGRAGARVEVSSSVQDDVVVYQVRDNGVGFDSRYADKLFQSFQRLHPAEDWAGIGVGLAIVHRVLLRHGGRIWADGQIGVGSTFSFELRKAHHAAA
jgi:PAS domain S-box-containing protein